MHRFRQADSKRRGGVLALVLIVVATIGALSAGMMQLSSAVTRRQAASVNRKLAFYMAEAGLAEAYAGLAIGKTGSVGTEQAPAAYAEGLFWVEATVNPDATVTLEATGMVGNGRAVLSMVVEPELSSVAALGIFADGLIDIQPGTLADGWDSDEGAYSAKTSGTGGGGASQPLEPESTETFTWRTETVPQPMGRVGSNGPIQVAGTLKKPTEIDGDVTPGPTDVVTETGEVTIHGSTVSADNPVLLPDVTVPTYTELAGITHTSGVPLLIQPGQAAYAYIRVQPDAEVVFQGPLSIVLDELRLEPSATLAFDTTGGGVSLFVTEALHLGAGSQVTTSSALAQDVIIQVQGATTEPVQLAADSSFYGILYAPSTVVELHSPFEIFGSVVGETLQFVGPAQLHFDRNLVEIAEELALPRLVAWRIVEISNPNGMLTGSDPFQYLGVDPAVCPPPDKAHEDQTLVITYRDKTGTPKVYDGPESGFDWSLVWDVQGIQRDGVSIDPEGGGVATVGGLGGLAPK